MERNQTPPQDPDGARSTERHSTPDPFAEYVASLWENAFAHARGREDAEDIAQEAVLAVWERRYQLGTLPPSELIRYVARTAVNKAHDADRRAWRRTPLASAGWHPDPDSGTRLRYWDGMRWTDRVWAGHEESRCEPTERASRLLPRFPSSSSQHLDEIAGESWQPSQGNTTEGAAIANALYDEIDQLIEELPAQQAEAIRLEISGYSHHEVAAMLGATPSTANSRRYHGRTQLRTRLEQRGLL